MMKKLYTALEHKLCRSVQIPRLGQTWHVAPRSASQGTHTSSELPTGAVGVCVCVGGGGVITSLCKGIVPFRGGAALHSPACTPSPTSRPPRPASLCRCVWPVQRGARLTLSLCKQCLLRKSPRSACGLAVSISRGRCAAVASSILLYPMPVLPIPAHLAR
jgi:hypothetical protein